jgi:hypothetical protein
VYSNRFLDPLWESVTDFQVLRREPAAHALGLQVGVQPLDKLLVADRVADEA